MAQNYYDEFVKLPLDKMAQKWRIWRSYTMKHVYPKNITRKNCQSQWKKWLNQVSKWISLRRTIEHWKNWKQNGKWFFQALLCLEVGVKPSTIKPSEYQALELTYAKFAQIKKAKAMASDWLDTFESIEKMVHFIRLNRRRKIMNKVVYQLTTEDVSQF